MLSRRGLLEKAGKLGAGMAGAATFLKLGVTAAVPEEEETVEEYSWTYRDGKFWQWIYTNYMDGEGYWRQIVGKSFLAKMKDGTLIRHMIVK